MSKDLLLSVVVPVYNEAASLAAFHDDLVRMVAKASKSSYEIIYCDDGSTDNTAKLLKELSEANPKVKILRLSRNFGKEIATTAGIHAAHGEGIMTVDADGQHPVELIWQFVQRWQAGAMVVIGLREANRKEGWLKRWGSRFFYSFFNRVGGVKMIPNSTDFRLIDKQVQADFKRMTERSRITRGLIDWLGYERDFIKFTANPRLHGEATYSFKKLFKLAVDSIISLSISPLYIAAYIGAIILPLSTLLGLGMVVNALIGDPLGLHVTGSAYIVVLLLFLVGIVLLSQAIIGLYLSHIHTETQNRPLYVVDKEKSIGLKLSDKYESDI